MTSRQPGPALLDIGPQIRAREQTAALRRLMANRASEYRPPTATRGPVPVHPYTPVIGDLAWS
ncbi:hypothetical protein AB0C02_30345 [Micromonospora sp. NPDC048999]|uniref:hypothetical protein n=1 Tax=Micromonospora sp. NPDC048999 TaxID=3155391 RepID=UPI00340B8092